jgi:hypothetical protein
MPGKPEISHQSCRIGPGNINRPINKLLNCYTAGNVSLARHVSGRDNFNVQPVQRLFAYFDGIQAESLSAARAAISRGSGSRIRSGN